MSIPYEFATEDFLKDHTMMRFVFWMMRRISTETRKIPLKNKRQHLGLEPFEFMYGCDACAKEAMISPQAARTRLDQLLKLGYLEKVFEKSTSTFSVFRLVTTAFLQNQNQHKNQHEGQHTDQRSRHKRETKKRPDVEETTIAIEAPHVVDKSPLSEKEEEDVQSIVAFYTHKGFSLKKFTMACNRLSIT